VSNKSEYYQVTDGEWIKVPKRGYKEQCCDCGLIHRLNFRVDEKGHIHIQTFRDNRATTTTSNSPRPQTISTSKAIPSSTRPQPIKKAGRST
jgi:hypothetical protein